MGILWGAVLACVFIEGGFFVLLNISWSFLQRNLVKFISALKIWFGIVLVFLSAAFLQAFLSMRKQQEKIAYFNEYPEKNAAELIMRSTLSLFREERNVYLASFALVMLVVVQRFSIVVAKNIQLRESAQNAERVRREREHAD